MSDRVLPRYPVYIPSKGRYENCLSAKFFAADGVPFKLVIEATELDGYKRYGEENLLVLPWCGDDETRRAYCAERGIENGGLIAARNWIKEHSIALGAERHWQFDDNIKQTRRWYKGKRIACRSNVALAATEDFVDRYENVAIAGLNYTMFAHQTGKQPRDPFWLNVHVYSASLILNSLPHRWRIAYNDDTDICLQVLADGWCTVLMNAFMVDKMRTMVMSGGNTSDLYQGDGRLKMARALERRWNGVVSINRRFQRPQHIVRDNWKKFDTPLKLKPDAVIPQEPNEYGLKLKAIKQPKSERIRAMLEE